MISSVVNYLFASMLRLRLLYYKYEFKLHNITTTTTSKKTTTTTSIHLDYIIIS